MKRFMTIIVMVLLLSSGCVDETQVVVPNYDAATVLAGTTPISRQVLTHMEGVYEVVEGAQLLGKQVVAKQAGGALSLFGERDASYCILECGEADSALIFTGYWRKQLGVETGVVRFRIEAADGGRLLMSAGPLQPGAVTITGEFGNSTGQGMRPLKLVYQRPLYDSGRPFLIIAHRAGGRNSDYLPASENSAELVKLADRFGANGVEIDVQLSKDGVPVIYHDEDMNLRLNQKSGLVGSVSDYTIAQLESFVRLKNGERIPTLRRMLATILRQTSLRFVWLDSKSSVPISMLTEIQRTYRDSARILGRDLTIVIGLPDVVKAQELLQIPDYESAQILCELDVETTRNTDAEIWAPRWTLGTQNDRVAEMQAEGRRAVTWTLDSPAYIAEFIKNGHFDGILTNYPTLVAYLYYSQ